MNSDTADPHTGRWSLKVNLGSAIPVTVTLPLSTPLPLATTTAFTLSFAVRSSPAGVGVAVSASHTASHTAAGAAPSPVGPAVVAGVEWRMVTADIDFAVGGARGSGDGSSVAINFAPHLQCGGAVWLDSISLVASS